MLHIHTLNVSNNQLHSLTGVPSLVSLKTLIADDNQLQGLPPGIEELELLKVLSIRNNRILTRIWEYILYLQVFSFLNKMFIEVTDANQLRSAKVVKVLRLQGNPLCNRPGWEALVTDKLVFLEVLNDHAIVTK